MVYEGKVLVNDKTLEEMGMTKDGWAAVLSFSR